MIRTLYLQPPKRRHFNMIIKEGREKTASPRKRGSDRDKMTRKS